MQTGQMEYLIKQVLMRCQGLESTDENKRKIRGELMMVIDRFMPVAPISAKEFEKLLQEGKPYNDGSNITYIHSGSPVGCPSLD